MRRVLIFANTHYQLILAIQMKKTVFKDCEVCLALSNHSNNTEPIFHRLKESQYFDECVYVKNKGYFHNRSRLEKLKEFFQLVFSKTNRYQFYLDDLKNPYFDEVLFYNLEIDTYGIYSILSEYNRGLKYSSYEEGVLSYKNIFYDSFKFKLIRCLRKMIGKPNLTDHYDSFYCIYPDVYDGTLHPVAIPAIRTDDQQISELLACIYDIQKTVDYSKYPYIYFESIYDTENRSIGELEFFKRFMSKVGKEKILVKKHPRSTIHVFEELGVDVDVNSNAPFEAIQLNNDLSACAFVAACSGSVLSVNSIVDKPSRVFLFYPMTQYEKEPSMVSFVQATQSTVMRFQAKGELSHLKIIHSLDEIQ